MDSTNSTQTRPQRIRGKRSRLYVFGITALTVFLAVAVIWPLRVTEFRSTAAIQLNVHKNIAFSDAHVKSGLMSSVAKLMSDEGLDKAIQSIGTSTSIQSHLLTAVDKQQLREKLQIKLLKSPRPIDVRISVELIGGGTPDETKLVNHLAQKLVSEFSTETVRVTTDQRKLEIREEIERLVNGINVDYSLVLRQLQKDVNLALTKLDRAKNQCATETVSSRIQMKEQPAVAEESFEIKKLENRARHLMETQNLTEFHPELIAIRQQIERLRSVPSVTTAANPESIQNDGKREVIKNQFVTASSKKQIAVVDNSGFQRILEQLDEVKLAEIKNSLIRLEKTFEFTNHKQRETLAKIEAVDGLQKDGISNVELADIHLADRSIPIGGTPTLPQTFLLLISSLLMAAAVATLFNPAASFQPFASAEQLTEETGLPVIGSIPKTNDTEKPAVPKSQFAVLCIVKCCEVFLILAAVILVASVMLRTGFIGQLLENPFHAAAKIFGG